MRVFFMTVVPSILLAALVALGVVCWQRHAGAAGCGAAEMTGCGTVAQLDQKLHLTPDQRTSVAAALQAYQRDLAAAGLRLAETRRDIARQLLQPNLADARVQAMADELSTIQRGSDLATLRYMRQTYTLLTPAQQAGYAAWVLPCVCGKDSAGEAACCCETLNQADARTGAVCASGSITNQGTVP